IPGSVLTAPANFSPITVASADAAGRLPGAQVVADLRAGGGRAFGSRIDVSGVRADIDQAVRLKWRRGGPQTPARLGLDGAFVASDYASEHRLHVGSRLSLEVPSGGRLPLRVRGIFTP